MSQPEHEAIVAELRSARITASPELRAHVRELAAAVPPAARRRGLRWRRPALALVSATVAVAVATAAAVGVFTSGSHRQTTVARREKTPQRPLALTDEQAQASGALVAPRAAGGGTTGSVPATTGRAQIYQSELTVKVANLSDATKRALRLTHDFHGYVRSVDYGGGTERGSAHLVLRVPVESVQAAIVELSALGELLDQHVSIQDVQPTVDRRFRQMQSIRDTIAKIQAKLESPTVGADERKVLENELVAKRRRLVVLQRRQATLRRLTSFATVDLGLRTADKAVVVPHRPNRIERTLDRSGSILLDEVKVVLFVLIVAVPMLAVAALTFGGVRLRRRRDEARWLAGA
jgi:FlaG/FlaF family flagellin (archaellin)